MEDDLGRTRSKPLRGQQRSEVAAELAEQFVQGTKSVRELASSVGRRPSLVRRLLAEAGVRTDGPECVGTDLDDTARIVRDCYRRSGSVQAVVEMTSLDRRVVRHLLALSVNQLGRSELAAEMGHRYQAGATLQEIAGETGQSYNQVRAALIEAGVSLRPPGGPGKIASNRAACKVTFVDRSTQRWVGSCGGVGDAAASSGGGMAAARISHRVRS